MLSLSSQLRCSHEITIAISRSFQKISPLIHTNLSSSLFLIFIFICKTKQQNVSSTAKETARQYVDFVHSNIELLRQRLSDEAWVLNLLYNWYDSQMLMLNKWLLERPVIVPIQAAAIKLIFKVCLISNVWSCALSPYPASSSLEMWMHLNAESGN